MIQTVPVLPLDAIEPALPNSEVEREGLLTIHPTENSEGSRYPDEILSVLLLTDGDVSETVLSQEVGLDLASLRMFLLDLEKDGAILRIDKTKEEWVIPAIA